MLLNFKKIGDVLSLDDYNAIIYLLKRGYSPSETILLTVDGYNGDFGTYTLITDNEEDLTLHNEGYTFLDSSKKMKLRIDNSFPDATYQLIITVEKYPEQEGITTSNGDYYEFEHTKRTITYESTKITENFDEIIIPLSDILPSFDDRIVEMIKIEAKINIIYHKYVIDYTTGSLEYNTDINNITNTESLISAITNAPEGQKTSLNLSSTNIFELNEQIIIKNKVIELKSGNVPAILDALNKNRHFFIDYDAKLILKNITLTNGNDTNETIHGGGSIYINSILDSDYEYLQGELECNDCNFNNNYSILHGGAIYSNDSILNCEETSFITNTCQSNGGAIYINNLVKG